MAIHVPLPNHCCTGGKFLWTHIRPVPFQIQSLKQASMNSANFQYLLCWCPYPHPWPDTPYEIAIPHSQNDSRPSDCKKIPSNPSPKYLSISMHSSFSLTTFLRIPSPYHDVLLSSYAKWLLENPIRAATETTRYQPQSNDKDSHNSAFSTLLFNKSLLFKNTTSGIFQWAHRALSCPSGMQTRLR